ncbi:MAG: hypothetical protein GF317_25140 [Candidatus Lokiarchaeota archaeon]|nr:hypothetical protein [Candidatus Lokiarchaeota archaeon]MBD3202645.1 hypothetical protein [Candidatus Lokiarchaeota archaeon]
MSQEVVETEDGLKIRKLIDLKPTTAKEQQDAMLHRVEYFSKRKDSVFNDFIENTVVQALKIGLNVKVQLDEMLGENKEKVNDILDKILMFGL